MKKKTKERTLTQPLLLIIILSLLEPALIISGILPPIFSYSLGNLLFTLATFLVVAYVAYSRADEELKTSALNGAVLGFTFASVICASGLVGKNYFGKAVLGAAADSAESLFQMLLLIMLENTLLSAVLSVIVTWLAKRFKSSKRPSPR
ncbi:MAG: hypothetical protein Sv326_1054 [Candidatus Fermentimicrarchaeum limneticum]|uniref:Uncharacterized protein n=1 Tax=Fermentimicrarchaeum limneticum TaxID=2795018 RepID=A0A7D5XKB0_FERL1|nr:MAG: hypothetical protein Sv326_1054 [Candidatus Fermentimicrarchaeum limneticum]